VLGGDLGIVNAIDQPHMVGDPDPHSVLRPSTRRPRGPGTKATHEVHPTRLGLPLLPQPRNDLLLRVPLHRVGGQHDAHRHGYRLARIVRRGRHGPTVSSRRAVPF
jgi:hypothetical protein